MAVTNQKKTTQSKKKPVEKKQKQGIKKTPVKKVAPKKATEAKEKKISPQKSNPEAVTSEDPLFDIPEVLLKNQKQHKSKNRTITIINKKEYYRRLHRYQLESRIGKMMSIILTLSLILLCSAYLVHLNKDHTPPKKETLNDLAPNYVFLGDSITEYYDIYGHYQDLPVVKSGVSGYETKDILNRMDDMVYHYNPSKVFLLIGTNDIKGTMEDQTDEEIAAKIFEIIEKIQEHRPKARIYLESIYPVSLGYTDRVQNINKLLKEYCLKHHLTYIDLFSLLEDENHEFSKDYSDDGLHPNDNGYDLITETLLPYVKEK